MEKLVSWFAIAVLGLAMLLFVSFLFSFPVYWLWNNALIGAVSGVQEITWLQAWGINILCGFLFKPTVNVDKKA